MIRAVIFDMDGTVFDTERVYRDIWVSEGKRFGITVDLAEDFPHIAGVSREVNVAYWKQKHGKDFPGEAFHRAWWDGAARALEHEVPLCAGVPKILGELRDMGCKLAIASSSPKERVERYLRVSGCTDYFDVIVSGERVKKGKPAPDIFLLAAEELGVEPAHCVVAEDAPFGVLGGLNAGMRTVMVPDFLPCPPELRPRLWQHLDTLEPLPELIARHNRALAEDDTEQSNQKEIRRNEA